MRKLMRWIAASGLVACSALAAVPAQAQNCSVWLVESSRFMNVPFGAFMPDRAFVPGSNNPMNNINTVDLPVNVGVIKCGKELILYDSGWKQQDYHKMTGTEHWAPLPDQLKLLGFNANDVTKIVAGHYQPDAGHLLWEGEPISHQSPAHAVRLGIEMVPQELSLVPALSAAENMFVCVTRYAVWYPPHEWPCSPSFFGSTKPPSSTF